MCRAPPGSTRPDTLLPRPALCRVFAAPRVGVEGARRDVLRQRVDRGGERVRWVGLIGPVATEDVEGPTTEQERAGVAVQLRDELADRRVGERRLPAAVGERVPRIQIGRATCRERVCKYV